MSSFDEDLNNLIWEREKLNAELTKELTRSHLLSKATTSLKALNDEAEAVVMRTLQGLGFAPAVSEHDDDHAIASRFAPPPLKSEQFTDEIFGQLNGRMQ